MVGTRMAARAAFGLAALACALGAWRAAAPRAAADDPLTEARAAVLSDPGDVLALHRLAYLAAEEAGSPTRESLAALARAYDLAPFPPPEAMIWRVDFAAAYWPSIPDALGEKTLSQVEALGGMSEQWAPRVQWCRASPVAAIAEAACATVPGVERGIDLPVSAGPPADRR